jgi:spermidine synthase
VNVTAIPWILVAHGRFAATYANDRDTDGKSNIIDGSVDPHDIPYDDKYKLYCIYTGEGMNVSVAVTESNEGIRSFHGAGKVQASSEPQDMRLQRMLGHLTTLLPETPRSVFVIGFGAGVTAGAVSIDPRVEKVTIAEIEPLVPRTVSTYFSALNFGVAKNPKVRVVVDDGRHVLATSEEKYDAITSDPLDPWVKGAAMLYSEEFFALAKSRLKPGGVMTLFVQLYSSSEAAVKSEVSTFFTVFPNGVVFGNTTNGTGYDLVLMGQAEPVAIDLDRFEGLLQNPVMAPVALSLREAGYESGMDLLSTYAGHARDLGPWMADAAITRDLNLRLQYLAGLGLNQRQGDAIYRNLLVYRRAPDGVFVGSDGLKAWLWDAIQNPRFR